MGSSLGDIFIADTNHHRIRRLLPDGKIYSYAGSGEPGFNGDDHPASVAELHAPEGLTVDRDGNLLVADTRNNRIRRVAPEGTIQTVAGGGSPQILGDLGKATSASLRLPNTVAVTPNNELYIADTGNNRVRRVTADGFITSAADEQSDVVPAQGGTAAPTGVTRPGGLAIKPDGTVLIADTSKNRLFKFTTLSGGFDSSNSFVPSSDGSEVYEFSPRGLHLKTIDPQSGAVVYSFEYESGRLVKVVDADGDETAIEHEDGKPSAIVGPYGQRNSLGVDSQGRLNEVTTPSGSAYGITYESGDLLRTFTMPNGATSTMTYDSHGRLTKDENAAGGFSELTRTDISNGHRVDVDSAERRRTTYEVTNSASTQNRKVTDPAGNSSTNSALPDGKVETAHTDGSSGSGETAPDPRFGLLTPFTKSSSARLPSGKTVTSNNSRSVSLANPDDPLSLLSETRSSTTNNKSSQSTYERTAPLGQTPGLNEQTGRLTLTSPAGRSAEVTLDAIGRPLTSTAPSIAPTTFTYDSRGRIASSTTDERTSTFTYDNLGNLASVTDPLGRSSTFEYDAAGRTTATVDPAGRRIEMTYDANGNLTSLAPPSRPEHTFTYNLVDLVTAISAPAVASVAKTTSYEYDQDQALTKAVRPNGDQITYQYDSAGRIAATDSPDGTETVNYSASTGQIDSATSNDGQQTDFAFDGPLPTSITSSGSANGALTFTYDNDLRLSTLATPGGATNFTYDNDSLLTTAGPLTLTRNASSGQLTATSAQGTSTTHTFNQYGEPASTTTTFPGGSYQETYLRDAAGRITRRTETSPGGIRTYDYTYDPSGRLTEVELNGNPYRQYTFDANGNRTSLAATDAGSQATTTATFDNQDKQTTQGDLDLTYNANGELTEKTDRETGKELTLSYKTSGDLASATTPSGKELTYEYDEMGNRTAVKKDGELAQAFLYAPGIFGPVAEVDASGTEVARFIYATRSHVPDLMIRGGKTYRLITDQLGSVRVVVDAQSGVVEQEISYDPYGVVMSDSNPAFQPFGFAGGLFDNDTGLTHFGAREYDAELGRWTSSDPIGFAGGDSNLYGYVVGDPVNFVDPSGLLSVFGHRVTPSLQEVSDFSAGFGDAATFGGTNRFRDALGVNGTVDKCSGWYAVGGYTGLATASAIGAGAIAAIPRLSKLEAALAYVASRQRLDQVALRLGTRYEKVLRDFELKHKYAEVAVRTLREIFKRSTGG